MFLLNIHSMYIHMYIYIYMCVPIRRQYRKESLPTHHHWGKCAIYYESCKHPENE